MAECIINKRKGRKEPSQDKLRKNSSSINSQPMSSTQMKSSLNEDDTVEDTEEITSLNLINCPAFNCTRNLPQNNLPEHVQWAHYDYMSQEADRRIQITLSDMRGCVKLACFQIIDEVVYTTFIEYFYGRIYLALQYQHKESVTKATTAVIRIQQYNNVDFTWKGQVKPYAKHKLTLKDYFTMVLTDIDGSKTFSVQTTIIKDQKQ